MEFKIDQKIVLIYFVLGACVSFASALFISTLTPISNLLLSIAFPVVIYVVALYISSRTIDQKKMTSIVKTSFMSYFLIWVIIWILLYNL